MTQSLKSLFNAHFWISDDYDLRDHSNISVVGNIAPSKIGEGIPQTTLYRPRKPVVPGKHAEEISRSPPGLQDLYKIAAMDMRSLGKDPDNFSMYVLYETGSVEPYNALRAGFWHFDLMRLLRERSREGKIPVALSYAVSGILPTIYLNRLVSPSPLLARETLGSTENHVALASHALLAGFIYRPRPGEVVRYDSLTMHRGAPNENDYAVQRAFMHIGFIPVS